MWPAHCIRDTYGAEYHPDLIREEEDVELIKGKFFSIDSPTAFGIKGEDTGLQYKLQELEVSTVHFAGFAFDQ